MFKRIVAAAIIVGLSYLALDYARVLKSPLDTMVVFAVGVIAIGGVVAVMTWDSK